MQKTEWNTQKLCTDVGEYELLVEKQKIHAGCEQPNHSSWKWSVAYHGAQVASGSVNKMEDAQKAALANVPAG